MRRSSCSIAAAVAVAYLLGSIAPSASAFSFNPVKIIENHVIKPIENHVVTPIENHVVTPIENHVVTPIENHVVTPIENHVITPIENHVVTPIDNHVITPIDNHVITPAVNHVLNPVVDNVVVPTAAAVGDAGSVVIKGTRDTAIHAKELGDDLSVAIADAAVAGGKGLWRGAQETYYFTSDATHSTVDALRTVDKYTLQPVKHFTEDAAIRPLWRATVYVTKPAVNAAGGAMKFADSALGMEGSLLPGGKFLDNGLGWIANRIGINDEVLKSSIDLTRNGRRVSEQLAHDLPVLARTVVGQSWDALSVDPTRPIGAVGEMTMGTIAVVGNTTMSVVQPVIVGYGKGLLYQSPNPEIIVGDGATGTGKTVYYVNGVNTTHDQAVAAARSLSSKIGRPVSLLYNDDHGGGIGGFAVSLGESAYDRIQNALLIGPLRALNGNSTSRRIAGAIVEAADRGDEIEFVGFSQGTLQIACGLQSAASIGHGQFIREHVNVVLAGTPLISAEIQPKPHELTMLGNRHDAVFNIVGGNWTNSTVAGNGHSFEDDYLSLAADYLK